MLPCSLLISALYSGCQSCWHGQDAQCQLKSIPAQTSSVLINLLCYAMLCYAMLCYAMLCYAMLCYAMLCYAMLCYAMLCYAMLCDAMRCDAIRCDAMLCYAMPCHAMLCYVQYRTYCYCSLFAPLRLPLLRAPPRAESFFNAQAHKPGPLLQMSKFLRAVTPTVRTFPQCLSCPDRVSYR